MIAVAYRASPFSQRRRVGVETASEPGRVSWHSVLWFSPEKSVPKPAFGRGVMLPPAAAGTIPPQLYLLIRVCDIIFRVSPERETSQLEILNGHIAHRSERS